jgi:hypothetical protein
LRPESQTSLYLRETHDIGTPNRTVSDPCDRVTCTQPIWRVFGIGVRKNGMPTATRRALAPKCKS